MSLTGSFETIDALIMQNQFKDAIKELKKIEKSAYDSWVCIGIYKRYSQIGEIEAAEKLIKKSLKKNSSNHELIAVYSKLLLKQERLEEAEKLSKGLKGTKYASIYSECILKKAQKEVLEDKTAFYKDNQFYEIYLESYKVTKNPLWIRNCAVFNLAKGLYQNASNLTPASFRDSSDAYFWALINYDAKKYQECADIMRYSENNFASLNVQQTALVSDAYIAISEIEKAEQVRRNVVQNIDSISEKTEIIESILPLIFVNSAVWAKDQGLNEQCADLLFYTVNRWPSYVPALILYSDFAYQSSLERKEDMEMQSLRRAGIATKEMERYDNRRKIPMSDALYRLDKALAQQANPYLSICKLDLTYKTNHTLTERDKERDLWFLLEDNDSISPEYKMLLVQYAVNFLLGKKDVENAWQIFYKYICDCFDIQQIEQNAGKSKKELKKQKKIIITKENFWEEFESNLYNFDLPIIEIAAWFAATEGKRNEALRLYEYSVYESGGILEEGFISPFVSTGACINLADIYFSIGKKDKALDLYGKAAGRESRNSVRSELFYRIAEIYVSVGDKKNALRSVDYATSIYPENAKASLLKEKLR